MRAQDFSLTVTDSLAEASLLALRRLAHAVVAPRRHRARSRRQDGVHHRAGPQPRPRRPAAAFSRLFGAGGSRAPVCQPQPDDNVPRFDYEAHVRALVDGAPLARVDPARQRAAAVASLSPEHFVGRRVGSGELNLDIVDYPGEWLLDLAAARQGAMPRGLAMRSQRARQRLAQSCCVGCGCGARLAALDPDAPEDEAGGTRRARRPVSPPTFGPAAPTSGALSTLPPGRFLMPGDLEGSPALTFSPLDLAERRRSPRSSLAAMMARRYEAAYSTWWCGRSSASASARLDRQIVLVDVLGALNGGTEATPASSRRAWHRCCAHSGQARQAGSPACSVAGAST